jgi:hypothetical protein
MLTVHHVFDFAPTWAPLERLATLLEGRADISPPEVESYMYMGVVVGNHEPVTIHLYKNVLTRHYLNVDDAGHAYVYRGALADDFDEVLYEPLTDLAAAIEHAQGEAVWMRSGRWPDPDHDAA